MYKVLVQDIKIPIIAGKNQKIYFKFNKGHELECTHPSLKEEFKKLVENGMLQDTTQKTMKERAFIKKEKKEMASIEEEKKETLINE
jgi:hypothetical protein